MTQLDVLYRLGALPSEVAAMAMARLREVYGVRSVEFREAERTVRIEYDASRLTEPVIRQMLRRAGMDLAEEISLIPPQLPPPESALEGAPAPVAAK